MAITKVYVMLYLATIGYPLRNIPQVPPLHFVVTGRGARLVGYIGKIPTTGFRT